MMHCNSNSTDLPNPKEQHPEPVTRPGREGLLEDWPQRASSISIEAHQEHDEAVSNSNSASHPTVNFSEFSSLRVYDDLDDLYRRTKAYSRKDREVFGAQAMMEANRIKRLIYASPPNSVKESIKYVLRNDIVTSDELVGIDHLILGRRSSVFQVRRDHMTAVLQKQQEQRRHQHQHQRQRPQVEEDFLIDLGKFAEQSSLKSTRSAIARASLSLSP